jgi:carboxyl-terminal processing protease
MSSLDSKRLNLWLPILFSIVLITGMVFGYKLNQSASFKKSITSIIQNDRLEEIVSLINNRYVDYVDEESLYLDGINGILSQLDPHTFYIPYDNVDNTNDNLKGIYKGIGLEYFMLEDTLVVVSVAENGGAADAGIQLGDKILRVNNEWIAGEGMDMDGVKMVFKNIKNDTFFVDVQRNNTPNLIRLKLVKSVIYKSSIDLSYKLAEHIGYIRINKFSENTYQEFIKALDELQPNSLQTLILDLRQNSGGYLDAAISILDEFFGNDEVLLKIKGKNFSNETFKATAGGKYLHGNIVVLIDETTASSSEIIAGAIQDWDRGIIIGRNSFGKGLVQEQFDLSDGSALRLTIARYYTPTGRSIQRDYSKGKQAYEAESDARLNGVNNWEVVHHEDDAVYHSMVHKRILYSGSGIEPDVYVKYPDFMLNPDFWNAINGIDNFTNAYFAYHIDEFLKFNGIEDFNDHFEISSAILNQYRSNLNTAFQTSINKVWKDPQQINYIKLMIKAKFARLLFRNKGYFVILNSNNEVIQKALNIIQTPNEYEALLNQTH